MNSFNIKHQKIEAQLTRIFLPILLPARRLIKAYSIKMLMMLAVMVTGASSTNLIRTIALLDVGVMLTALGGLLRLLVKIQ